MLLPYALRDRRGPKSHRTARRHRGACGGANGDHDSHESADPLIADAAPERRLDRLKIEDILASDRVR